jgi:hypothetical protein
MGEKNISHTLRQEHRLRMYEDRVVGKYVDLRGEVTGNCRKQLTNFCSMSLD